MTELSPFFGGIVTILFSIAFYWAIQEVKNPEE